MSYKYDLILKKRLNRKLVVEDDYSLDNIYVLDFNNKFLKKALKAKGPLMLIQFLIDLGLTLLLVAIHTFTWRSDFEGYASVFFIFIAMISYSLIEIFIDLAKYIMVVNVEKTFVLMKNNSIAILRDTETDFSISSRTQNAGVIGIISDNDLISLAFYGYYFNELSKLTSLEMDEYKKKLEASVNAILNDSNIGKYSIKRYDECKLLFETRKYCLYSGKTYEVKKGVPTFKTKIFKIYKVYIKASECFKEGVSNV